MGIIMHNNIPYGGGSSIEPNPQESATDQLETLGIDGDVYEVTDANASREVQETITEAQSRANLADGDSVPTIFGKIKKWFSDLKDLAFIGKDGTSSTKYLRGDGTWQNFPTIPTVNNGTLTIQKNGTNVATFSANQSANATANIECALPSDVEGSKVVTGNPLTITDAAGIKAENIEIGFEPKQDKHGYNSVWVGGGGKNKLNATVRTQTARSVQYTMAANNFLTVNGTATGNSDYAFLLDSPINLKAGDTIYFKLLNFSGSVGSNIGVWLNDYATFIGYLSVNNVMTIQYTCEADVQITYFIYRHYLSNVANNYTANVSLSVGESLSQFYPYENISPITGYTSISADGCGKNLFDESQFLEATDWTLRTSDGYYQGSSYNLLQKFEDGFNIALKSNTQYAMRFKAWSSNPGTYNAYTFKIQYIDGTEDSVGGKASSATDYSLVSNASKSVKKVYFTYGSNASILIKDFQFEEASSVSAYEPFKGDSVLVEFNQTLYGGKLTILQDGSADVLVDRGYLVKNTSAMNNNEDYPGWKNSGIKYLVGANKNEVVTTFLNVGTKVGYNTTGSQGTGTIWMPVAEYNMNQTQWIALAIDVQITVLLATPFTIHLSTVEALTLLQGINNVWTDGTTLSLTYQPDNAIGQAKGTAQDAMAMVNALASTAVKVIAKNGEYDAGVWGFNDMPNCSLSLDKGTYLIMAWCYFTAYNIDTNKEYGCAICDSSNTILSYDGHRNRTEDPEGYYGATSSTFILETITTDATVRKLRGYMCKSVTGNPIRGGIAAFKLS